MSVKYSLESKYATYYFDKIKDLPVFLVVVDVKKRKGWWLFLQPVLEANDAWRKQQSITVNLPVDNTISDSIGLREAVEAAKLWMRQHHPLSIEEAVAAHKERIVRIDPRFDVRVSLINDKPMFSLSAKEEVSLTITFADRDEVARKVNDLIDRGALVAFKSGEVRITGSKLFEQIKEVGCSIQAAVNLAGTLSLVCRDNEGKELGRLSDVPGRFTGGQKVLWFEGGFANSPLILKVGPLAPATGGSIHFDLNLHRWDGQPLLQLGYFDRLNQFMQALPKSVSTTIECQQDGNRVFLVTLPLQEQPFAAPLARYLESLSNARMVAQRFNVNPTWTVEAFDRDTQETADELHAILFGDGWTRPMPHVRLTASCVRKTFAFDVAKQAETPGYLRLESMCSYSLFGQNIGVGKLVHEYTMMSVEVTRAKKPSAQHRGRESDGKTFGTKKRSHKDTIEIALVGSAGTVMRVRSAERTSLDPPAGLSLLSEKTNVDFSP